MVKSQPSANRISARSYRICVAVISVVLAGYFVFVSVLLVKHGPYIRWFGAETEPQNGKIVVTSVHDFGPAKGVLTVGDTILAINGDERVQIVGAYLLLFEEPLLPSYTLLIERQGTELEVELQAMILDMEDHWIGKVPMVIAGIALWAMATFVGLLRPGDRVPRAFTEAGFAASAVCLNVTLHTSWWSFSSWELAFAFVLNSVNPIHHLLLYRFAAVLTTPGATRTPPPSAGSPDSESTQAMQPSQDLTLDLPTGEDPADDNRPRRIWHWVWVTLLVWTIAYYIVNAVFRVVYVIMLPGTIDFVARHAWFFDFWAVYRKPHWSMYVMAISFGTIAVMISNYRRNTDPAQKRRIKWIVYGMVAGLLVPAVLGIVGGVIRDLGYRSGDEMFWFSMTMIGWSIGIILIPISFGYGIAKHRILGVDVVVRRGIRYLMAKNILRLILLAPIIALAYSVLSNPDRTVSEIFTTGSRPLLVGMVLFAGLGLRYRQRLTTGLDRRFFRTRYDQEKILGELINSLKEEDSLDKIAELIEERIGSALHPERIVVVYRHPENPEFVSSTGGLGMNTSVQEDSELVRLAESSGGPIDLGPDNLRRRSMLPPNELGRLDDLGVELVVPMQGTSVRLTGLILLGAKKSEEAYSANDKRLISAIADQTAVVWENRWLTDRVNREGKVRREVLAHLGTNQVNLLKECPTCGACFDQSEDRCSEDDTELELTMPVERVIDDRYRLDRLLGRGGMGAVFRSTDLRLDRQVAVKIMMGHLFGDRTAQRRFEREAQTSAGLHHPRIIQVFDFGGIGDNGAYLVMELLEGETLRERIKRDHRLDPTDAAEIIDGVLDGLIAAHDAGVIHRDLKPENIMLASPPTGGEATGGTPDVKILDFGLAKLIGADVDGSGGLTATGAVLGTWTYMSPEQLLGQDVDERTDLFSLGVMAAEAITGERPFSGKNPTEMLRSLEHDCVTLDGSGAAVAPLEAILRIATARETSRRYVSATEMRDALIPALRSCPVLE